MFTPKEIDFIRVENIKTILRLENMKQVDLARTINMTPENLNRIIRMRVPVTETTAQAICFYFPKYRQEWLLGYDPYMTEDEKIRANESGIRINAPVTVLDTALLNVCHAEGIEAPTLDNIPELLLLVSQLNDYAEMLMKNYIHKNNSHFWNTLDQELETVQRKYQN